MGVLAIIPAVPQGRNQMPRLAVLTLLVCAALVLHLGWSGSVWVPPGTVIAELFAGNKPGENLANTIIWTIRLPRGLAAALVGGILGVVGAVMQSLFRNPLAEPYVLGVSSGAAFGGTLALAFGAGAGLGLLGMPLFGFLGAMGALALVMSFASVRGGIQMETLLIAGVVIGAMLAALVSLGLLMAGEDTNSVLRWLLGSMTPMYWPRVAVLAGVAFGGTALLWPSARKLNAFALGEAAAQSVGVEVKRLRLAVLAVSSAMVGTAVGSVGIIPFVGLMAPHAARRIFGHDLRILIPTSFLSGAGLLVLADIAAQKIKPGWELPVGAVTAVLGAPVLLLLMRRNQGVA